MSTAGNYERINFALAKPQSLYGDVFMRLVVVIGDLDVQVRVGGLLSRVSGGVGDHTRGSWIRSVGRSGIGSLLGGRLRGVGRIVDVVRWRPV